MFVIKGAVAVGGGKRLEKQKKGKREREGGRQAPGRKGSPAGPHLDPEQRQDVHVEPFMALWC